MKFFDSRIGARFKTFYRKSTLNIAIDIMCTELEEKSRISNKVVLHERCFFYFFGRLVFIFVRINSESYFKKVNSVTPEWFFPDTMCTLCIYYRITIKGKTARDPNISQGKKEQDDILIFHKTYLELIGIKKLSIRM